ncbi:MAG TPA: hypothetical protein ACQGQH_09480 [Xylella sp.]
MSDMGSPWAILSSGRFNVLQPMSMVEVDPWVEGRKSVTVDLNGVYFVRVVEISEAKQQVRIQS